ncbi:MAG: hypothetical protein EB018_09375, partial [Gammaproteobacteria bacterium]|nr:hypothetical protein [Gammaproteobacteria bacterium]
AQAQAGEHVLVTGASGGVGSAAVQLAKRRGARVTAIAGSTKAAEVRAIGADRVVGRDDDVVALLGEESVDLVVDNVAGPHFDSMLKLLRRGGRYVSSGAIGGPIVSHGWRWVALTLIALLSSSVTSGAQPPTAEGDRLIAEFGLREAAVPMSQQQGWRPPQKIIVDASIPGLIEALRGQVPGVQFFGASTTAAIDMLSGADALIGSTAFICDERLLAAGKDLRWLQSVYAGVEACAAQSNTLMQRKIVVTNLRAISAPVIAEHVIAFTFALSRGLDAWIPLRMQRVWADDSRQPPMTVISGKTMLIVGLGGIGNEVAKRAHALGMRVIATRATPQAKPDHVDYVGASSELEKLIGEADVVVNALPLTAATTGLFDAAMFARMRRSAFFINVGRGQTVVTADLTAALQNKTIAAAALDVVDPEPLPKTDPLWDQPNLVLTPHVSGSSDLGVDSSLRVLRENLRRYASGGRLLSVVDVKRGY